MRVKNDSLLRDFKQFGRNWVKLPQNTLLFILFWRDLAGILFANKYDHGNQNKDNIHHRLHHYTFSRYYHGNSASHSAGSDG
jgi:hypothetical protein